MEAAPTTVMTPTANSISHKILAKVIPSFKSFVFRRIESVNTIGTPRRFYFTHDKEPVEVTDSAQTFTSFEYEHNIEERAEAFNFITLGNTVRRESDRFPGVSIQGFSQHFCEFDVEGGTFALKKVGSMTPPRKGDLICGLAHSRGKGNIPAFNHWFLCSEQFLHAWTALMYPEPHETLCARANMNIELEDSVRSFLMSGNRLSTSTYRKWLMSEPGTDKEGKVVPIDRSEEEHARRFYHLRTENASQTHVHLYAALVLMGRYGEAPVNDVETTTTNEDGTTTTVKKVGNYARNLRGESMTRWDLPEGWVEKMLA